MSTLTKAAALDRGRALRAVTLPDGASVMLRPLPASAIDRMMRMEQGDTAAVLELVGLALVDDDGRPWFSDPLTDADLEELRKLPLSLINALAEHVTEDTSAVLDEGAHRGNSAGAPIVSSSTVSPSRSASRTSTRSPGA